MATWFSRLGRAVAATVSLYVLVTVGWMFLMLALLGGGPSEGPGMASPFLWVGEMSFELAQSNSIDLRNIDWAIFWLIVCALGAAGLLTITLASFDRCLGRIEDVFTRLARPSRRARIVATVYFSLGMILSRRRLVWLHAGDSQSRKGPCGDRATLGWNMGSRCGRTEGGSLPPADRAMNREGRLTLDDRIPAHGQCVFD